METKFIVTAFIDLSDNSKGFQELVRGFRKYRMEVTPSASNRDIINVKIRNVSRKDIVRYEKYAMCNVNFDYSIELTDDEYEIFFLELENIIDSNGIARF